MIRDDERVQRYYRDDRLDPRREPTYRLPRGAPLRPVRRRRAPVVLAGAVLLAAAGGGLYATRTFGGPDIDATVAGAETGGRGAAGGATIMVPREIAASHPGYVSTLRGLVGDATSLTANGEPVAVEPGGQFRFYITQGTRRIRLQATDAAGHVTKAAVRVTDDPTPPAYPRTVAVHVRASDWNDPAVRDQVIGLARSGRINAVQLDIKDEAGEVGYASDVELASTVGAAAGYYDAREALDELHELGVRVIGRIVCFLDPLLAGWAWENGRADLVVLDGAGAAPLANNYGTAAFSNLGSAEVRQYQIDLAMEAARLGFDEILYDYVRRPEGDLEEMQFTGLDVPPEVAVAQFVVDTKARLQPTETELGVSVFGISATRPEPTAQDIGLLAPNVDYVSPMVYPSHWGSGEYGVADPNRQPADIVRASVADFERLTAGSGAAVVPWLQDFSSGGVEYGPAEVRAQIEASYDVGAEGFLLWNAHSVYHGNALEPLED